MPKMKEGADNAINAFNEAVDFAIEESSRDTSDNAILFLTMWREGDWEAIKDNFPNFDLGTVLEKPEYLNYDKEKNLREFINKFDAKYEGNLYEFSVADYERLAFLIHKRVDISTISWDEIKNLKLESGTYMGKARELILWRAKGQSSHNITWASNSY